MSAGYGEFPVIGSDRKWTGEWRTERFRVAPTLTSLRQSSRYWIRDVARDLRPRTIDQVYAENRAGRRVSLTCPPLQGDAAAVAYKAWCKSRKHKPHPASLDRNHPHHKGRPAA